MGFPPTSVMLIQTSRLQPTLNEEPAVTVTLAAEPQIPQPGNEFQDSHAITISQVSELTTVTCALILPVPRKRKTKITSVALIFFCCCFHAIGF
jgi:hypothetical protein